MLQNQNYDSDDFDEERLHKDREAKLTIGGNTYIPKKKAKFDRRPRKYKGKGGNEEDKQQYGNSYGKKGQTNNTSLFTNEDLRASMW